MTVSIDGASVGIGSLEDVAELYAAQAARVRHLVSAGVEGAGVGDRGRVPVRLEPPDRAPRAGAARDCNGVGHPDRDPRGVQADAPARRDLSLEALAEDPANSADRRPSPLRGYWRIWSSNGLGWSRSGSSPSASSDWSGSRAWASAMPRWPGRPATRDARSSGSCCGPNRRSPVMQREPGALSAWCVNSWRARACDACVRPRSVCAPWGALWNPAGCARHRCHRTRGRGRPPAHADERRAR